MSVSRVLILNQRNVKQTKKKKKTNFKLPLFLYSHDLNQ